MKVLLSIKPEFADKIFEGEKKFEFRRSIYKRNDVEKIIVYASFPISKVIGEFEVDQILFDDLHSLWNETERYAGITKKYFFEYFNEKSKGYAIKVKNCKRYDTPFCLKTKFGVLPPQSFLYLN